MPKLANNLLSVPKVRKEVTIDDVQGHIGDDQRDIIAAASNTGSLYYLNCEPLDNSINAATVNANLGHRRFCHINERSLCKLARTSL